MAHPLETVTENDSVDFAESFGVMSVKCDKAHRDWPDRCFFLPRGAHWFVEFKRLNEKPRKRQKEIHDRLCNLGHVVDVIDDTEIFKARFFARLGMPWPYSADIIPDAQRYFHSVLLPGYLG